MDEDTVGRSQGFVLAQGFEQVGGYAALVGHDGGRRLFAELTADPDRLEVRPEEAYRALLSSMQPGWVVRLLQIRWPDPITRQVFQGQVEGWGSAHKGGEGLDLLQQGLTLFLEETPLPFTRRTILEFISLGEEGLSWWEGLPGLLSAYGIQAFPLSRDEIVSLAKQIFNPVLE